MARQSISEQAPLLLGSASPRRRDILSGLGLPILVRPGNVDEQSRPDESVDAFLERVVVDKLEAALAVAGEERFSAALTADTVVVVDHEVLGKPINIQDAERLLHKISGRSHVVKTCFAIADARGQVLCCRRVESEVTLRAATPEELRRYAATGEGLDKAGAYAVQGQGAFLVRRIQGSYTNVVGLPACEVVEELLQLQLLEGYPPPTAGVLA